MSKFVVPVTCIRAIEPIKNADKIELAVVGDYHSVISKGQYKTHDLVVYLPEAAILPDRMIDELGLKGKLSGDGKNRIKAVRLRGCLSQGIIYGAVPEGAVEGNCVAERLGIKKFEPPVPVHMSGELVGMEGLTVRYDIENFKSYPDVLIEGEVVEMTEKTHGTFVGFAVEPGLNHPDMLGGDGLAYSKGAGARGQAFKNNAANATNIYLNMAKTLKVHDAIRKGFPGKSVHVLGEIFGTGVQDLTYGRNSRSFVAFDICIDGHFLGRDAFADTARKLGLERAPVLYRGPFSKAAMNVHTNGMTVVGSDVHLREGLVVVPVQERCDETIGRVILKSVSGDYLTRSGNATEFN